MKVSKGQSQPEIVAAAFLILYMVLGQPFLCQALILTHLPFLQGYRCWLARELSELCSRHSQFFGIDEDLSECELSR